MQWNKEASKKRFSETTFKTKKKLSSITNFASKPVNSMRAGTWLVALLLVCLILLLNPKCIVQFLVRQIYSIFCEGIDPSWWIIRDVFFTKFKVKKALHGWKHLYHCSLLENLFPRPESEQNGESLNQNTDHPLATYTKQLASLGHVMKTMDIFNQDDPSNYGKNTVLWRLLEFRGSKKLCRESINIKPPTKGQSATGL